VTGEQDRVHITQDQGRVHLTGDQDVGSTGLDRTSDMVSSGEGGCAKVHVGTTSMTLSGVGGSARVHVDATSMALLGYLLPPPKKFLGKFKAKASGLETATGKGSRSLRGAGKARRRGGTGKARRRGGAGRARRRGGAGRARRRGGAGRARRRGGAGRGRSLGTPTGAWRTKRVLLLLLRRRVTGLDTLT
jgi:hypothetical protein